MSKSAQMLTNGEVEIHQQLDALTRRVDNLQAAYAADGSDEIALKDAILEPINRLSSAVENLTKTQNEFMGYQLTNGLIPAGPFLLRYQSDHPIEKQAIASFVAKRFFAERGTPQRCFVQASSLALHLTYALVCDPAVPGRSLIHTNSAVAHLPILYGKSNGRISIWPLCGKSFDPVCAGWQIPPNHDEGFEYLRSLFTRPTDPLTTVFLMPLFVTPSEGIFYEHSDAAQFADALAFAGEIVVLAPGNRIVANTGALPTERMYFPALQSILQGQHSKAILVVSSPGEAVPDIAKELRKSFGTVHWQGVEGWVQVS